ncbi:hypothetical protein G6011_05966 [Alternaria panax]|uniref:Uncharacterized protein n=1 Tax=Alternaria panax TaxID=48097 RepID=A0AAD4FFM5_9PLEO|nr:hypothetical protein G6011_05966 [Alternaria panax]
MANNRVHPATPQLTHVALGDWSRSEYLYIQLQSELLLAVACLPALPRHLINDAAQYIGYYQYFAIPSVGTGDSLDEAGSGVVKGVKAFIDKRDELSGFVMWALRQTALALVNAKNVPGFHDVQVTPAMLQDYRQIRERLGFHTYLHDPKLLPELWKFLQDVACSQFPQFSGDATEAGPTQDVDTNADVDIDVDSTPIVEPVPADHTAATSDHGPSDYDEIPDAGADADDNEDAGDAKDNTEDSSSSGAAQPATRPGPDDFLLETGTVQCTAFTKETGERCTRRAKNENEDRRSWMCHNHDPVRKQKTYNDRMARNRANKAANNGNAAKKDGAAKSKQQQKKKKAGKKAVT